MSGIIWVIVVGFIAGIIARQAGLRSDGIDLVGAERAGEIARRDRLVLALADP